MSTTPTTPPTRHPDPKEPAVPQYLLSVHHDDDLQFPEGVTVEDVFRDVDAYNQRLRQGGNWVFGAGLLPASSATVVDASGPGAPVITDGPYLESKEYLGGFWIVRAADLDEALKLGTAASAACHGPVEVRPVQDEPEG